ncbi:MAG: nucleotidyltransferase domain-containing protein [Bacteroidetes bacterium]|nr:nucleotidyltransferase domain-containing protein [Bacteroidota bacterium]
MINQEKQNIIVNYLAAYEPKMIGIFGSYARGEETPESDIDILVDLRAKITLIDLVKFHQDLEILIGNKVDVVTLGGLRNEKLKEYIFKDLKYLLNEKG